MAATSRTPTSRCAFKVRDTKAPMTGQDACQVMCENWKCGNNWTLGEENEDRKMDYFDSDIEPFVDESGDEVDGRMNGSRGGPTTAAKTKGSDEFTLSDLSARYRNAPRESSPKRRRVQYSSSPMTLRTTYTDFAHLCVSLYTKEDANSSIN